VALSFLYRLITTTTDPSQAPAAELAGLHPERWEFETALAETKTHQRGSRVVLRSKAPEGVTQELYGHFCVRYAARWLMHTVALVAGGDPDRVLPPQVLDEAHDKPARSSSSCSGPVGCARTRESSSARRSTSA